MARTVKKAKSAEIVKLSETNTVVLRLVEKHPDSIPYKLWRHARRLRINISEDVIEDQYNFLDGKGLIARPSGANAFTMRFVLTDEGRMALKTGATKANARKSAATKASEAKGGW